ncbi:PREDICTED: uncharacterized protein LOC109462837 [Branchiostoma belcheri]|uniref:Uncharacterized protein LOC109462837 n=1 Tax=Branchiostoma belcheri TaxID=7741 RepID=A0A6P4XWV7_BRABE|nr:PREDICTED: uncharacterized protein LOC109462837 [Branchiostoma belcheri]
MWTLPVLTAAAALLLVLSVDMVGCVPPEMSADMYCLGCKATVKELIKVVESKDNRHQSHANKVAKAMETTCKHDNFNRLKYVPGKYVEACLQLLETYHSTVESLLMNTDHSDLEQQLCHDLSDACHGAPDHKHDPKRPTIHVDDNGNVKFVEGTHVKAKRPNPVRPTVHSEL